VILRLLALSPPVLGSKICPDLIEQSVDLAELARSSTLRRYRVFSQESR
jgi:hypothetical protein